MADRYGRILYFIVGNPDENKYFGFPIKTKYPISIKHPVQYMDVVESINEFLNDVEIERYIDDGEDILFRKADDRLRFSKNFDFYPYDEDDRMDITVHRNHLTDLKLEWETVESLQKKHHLFNECAFILANFLRLLYYDASLNIRFHNFIIPCESMIAIDPADAKLHQDKLVISGKKPYGIHPEDDFSTRLNIAFNLQLWVTFEEPGMNYKKYNYGDYYTRKYAEKVESYQEIVRSSKKLAMFPFYYRNYTPEEEKALISSRSRMPLYGQGFFAMNPIIQGQLNEREIYLNPSYIGWKLVHKPHPNNPFRLVYKRECQYPGYLGNGELNKCDGDDLVAIVFKPKENPEPYFDLKMDDYIGSDVFFELNKHLPVDEQTQMHLELANKQDEWHRRLDYKLEMRSKESQLAKDINSVIPDFILKDAEEEEDIERRQEAKNYLIEDRGREVYPFDDIFSPTELLKYYKSYGGKYEWGYYDLKFSIDHINLYISQFGFKDIPYIGNKIQNALRNELFYILLFSGVNISACPIITQNIICDLKYSLYDTRLFREGLRDFFSPKVRMALCQIMDDMMERIKSIIKGSQFGDNLSYLIKKINN